MQLHGLTKRAGLTVSRPNKYIKVNVNTTQHKHKKHNGKVNTEPRTTKYHYFIVLKLSVLS